jgi:predicted metalloprotease with PDZ domain
VDLNLFEFDYDLTFIVFFLNTEGRVYARYGGRDAEGPDTRQSLAGLDYTMRSVLRMHERADKEFAPRSQPGTRTTRDLSSFGRMGRCMHCHQVKERLNAELRRTGKWTRDLAWRYPLPENLGFALEVDRGNVVKEVKQKSAAAAAGLRTGDTVLRLNGVPVHSFADAQFALDHAPATGTIAVSWQRDGRDGNGRLALAAGWKKSDLSWRPAMQQLIPAARLYGTDLTAAEKQALGLSAGQLAFRQKDSISSQARAAGIRPGDVILGIDDESRETDVDEFLRFVYRNYLVGDKVTVHVLRDGKRLDLPMTLGR